MTVGMRKKPSLVQAGIAAAIALIAVCVGAAEGCGHSGGSSSSELGKTGRSCGRSGRIGSGDWRNREDHK